MRRLLAAFTIACALALSVLADGGTEHPKCGDVGQTACASIPVAPVPDDSFIDEIVETVSLLIVDLTF